jgi:hypothetical protein
MPAVSVAGPSSSRGSKINVTSIGIVPVAGEHDDCQYYLNTTHSFEINLKNNGDVYLEDLNVTYTIYKMGTTLELEGYKITTMDLAPGQTSDEVSGPIMFSWSPSETNKWYIINVTMIKAKVFGAAKTISLKETGMNISIKAVSNDVEPIGYALYTRRLAEHNSAWPSVQSSIVTLIKNMGNVAIPGSTWIYVNATIYNSTGAQKWFDNYTHDTGLTGGEEHAEILTQWVPTEGYWTINMMTKILGVETNLSMPIFIQNVTDAKVARILNYQNDTSYSNDSIEVQALFKNSGNRQILNTYQAKLEIKDMATSAVMYTDILAIPQVGGNNIINPQSSAQVNFSAWNGSNGIQEGSYWINASVYTATEDNGTTANNMTSIIIHIGNNSDLDVEITEPSLDGKYPYNSTFNKVIASVTNIGTLTVIGYDLTLTIKDDNSGEVVFTAYKNFTTSLGPSVTKGNIMFDAWPDTYNGNFTYNVTVMFSGQTTVLDWSARKIVMDGGPDWGNITGTVTSMGIGMVGASVGIFDDGKLLTAIQTNSIGNYKLTNIPAATTPGTIYNVSAFMYGYTENWNPSVAVINGKETTNVDFELGGLLPMGNITGTVTLVEISSGDSGLDYTDIVVSVKGTPLSVNPDTNGNFAITDVVVGTVNVTATKPNFTPDYNSNVIVAADQNVSVDLTLVESWAITVTPEHKSVDIAVGTKIKVVFEDEMNKSSVNAGTFNVSDSNGGMVGDPDDSGQLVWTGNSTFTFSPAGGLATGEDYLIKISVQIKNIADGKVIHRAWKSTFTTLFIKVPVSGVVVDDESGDPIFNATVKVGSTKTKTLADGSYSMEVIVPDLNATIAASAPYYLSGNIKEIDFVTSGTFTDMDFSLKRNVKIVIEVEIDDEKSTVNHLVTLRNVDLDTSIYFEFLEPIEITSLDMTLKNAGGDTIGGNFSYNSADNTAKFEPLQDLESLTTYELTIQDTLVNMTGVQIMIWDTTWTFETIEVLNFWEVLSYGPKGEDVALTEDITITFSDPMNTASVESAFSITPAVTGGSFSWNTNGTQLTWTHGGFEAGETYIVTIPLTVVTQLNVSALSNFTWTFSTIAPPSSFKVGPITDKDGNIIDFAEVTITDASGNLVWGGKTDSEGYIVFNIDAGLESGNYSVKVSKYGFQEMKFNFEVDDDGTVIPGYDVPQMKETEKTEEEPAWTWIVIIVLIILIVVFLVLAFMPKKEPMEEEYMEEEERAEEEPYEEELEGEEEEMEDEDEELEEREQAELDEFESEDEPFDEEEIDEGEEEVEEELEEDEDFEEGEGEEEGEAEEEELEAEEEELPEEEEELPEEEEELPEEDEDWESEDEGKDEGEAEGEGESEGQADVEEKEEDEWE